MKVLLLNGSPHKEGCTFTALREIEKTLNEAEVETEIVWIGMKPIGGCIGCGKCSELGKCIIDDGVNEFVDKAAGADGFIFGSPVHYAAASGNVTSFLDRAMYSASKRRIFHYKPGSVIVSARRGGTTAAYDQLNKYLGISEMPIISSTYWNMVHGSTAEDVVKDEEGMQCMQVLGRNMAYFLKCIEAGKKANVALPERENKKFTNFIRG